MSRLVPGAAEAARYAYLGAFFVLLAGFFHPLISGSSGEPVVLGTVTLFVGLAGGALAYRGASSQPGRRLYLGAGLGLVGLSLLFILQLTGRSLL